MVINIVKNKYCCPQLCFRKRCLTAQSLILNTVATFSNAVETCQQHNRLTKYGQLKGRDIPLYYFYSITNLFVSKMIIVEFTQL